MLHRFVVHLDFFDALGMEIRGKFLTDRLKEDHDAGNLDAAAGTARAGADKHEEHQHRLAGSIPQVKVSGGKAGGGDDGRHLKGGMRQRLKSAGAGVQDIHKDNACGYGDNQQIIADFFHFQSPFDVSQKEQIIGVKVDAKQDHKDRYDPLDIGGVGRNTVVFDAEAACSRRAERRADRVKQRHFSAEKQQNLGHGQPQIDQVEETRRRPHLRHQLADRGARTLRAHQVDIGAAAQRDDGQQKDQHAHAADPVREAAPEQGTVGQRLHLA